MAVLVVVVVVAAVILVVAATGLADRGRTGLKMIAHSRIPDMLGHKEECISSHYCLVGYYTDY